MWGIFYIHYQVYNIAMDNIYIDYAVEKTLQLLEVDSPTGYTDNVASSLMEEFSSLGFEVRKTNKGGVIVDLGGEEDGDGLCLMAHMDTIGAIVSEIKADGRLRMDKLGGLHPVGVEGENVRIHTRDGKTYEGTIQIPDPSVHVNDDFDGSKRDWRTLECVLDEDVRSEEDVRKLSIEVGDPVCLFTGAHVTPSGYIKSRFLDDKLSVGILLSLSKYISDNHSQLKRHTYIHITAYEEVGHGASASVPEGVTEGLSIDMGCVGKGVKCTEREVSICAKDARGPYNYAMVGKLIESAKKEGAAYAVDTYPHYSSDVEAALSGGADIRHGLIGPGVFASHCNERSHRDGVKNTLLLLKGYLEI